MSAATEAQVHATIAELKKAPRQVQAAVLWSLGVGAISLLRFLATAYAGRMSFGKAALYGLLMLAWFWFNGFSLYHRSKWGFSAVAGSALLPILGVLGFSVHLLRPALEGSPATNWSDTILSVVGLAQLVVTFMLFRQLFAKEAREYVWKGTSEPSAGANGGRPAQGDTRVAS